MTPAAPEPGQELAERLVDALRTAAGAAALVPPAKRLMTRDDVADYLRASRRTTDRLLSMPDAPPRRYVGLSPRWVAGEVYAWAEGQTRRRAARS